MNPYPVDFEHIFLNYVGREIDRMPRLAIAHACDLAWRLLVQQRHCVDGFVLPLPWVLIHQPAL